MRISHCEEKIQRKRIKRTKYGGAPEMKGETVDR